MLYSRLKRASEEVCGIKPHVINGSLAETLEASVDKIGSDALTAIRTG